MKTKTRSRTDELKQISLGWYGQVICREVHSTIKKAWILSVAGRHCRGRRSIRMRRGEERHGGGRGCGRGRNGQDVVAEEDPSVHPQKGIQLGIKFSDVRLYKLCNQDEIYRVLLWSCFDKNLLIVHADDVSVHLM